MMLGGRAAAGFFAAATRVVAISIVRDRYIGDRMASIMSTIFIVFMIVPVLAPTFGQVILYFANWRWIFGALLLIGALITGWVAFRLPETLTPENRIGISLSDIGATFRSEEHTSELQSLMRISYAVFCLKKKHK